MAGSLVVTYRSSRSGDRALAAACSQARSTGLDLTVLVPLVTPAEGAGCCGIRGAAWVALLRDAMEDEAAIAEHRLRDQASVNAEVLVLEGPSEGEILRRYVAAAEDRAPAAPPARRRWGRA